MRVERCSLALGKKRRPNAIGADNKTISFQPFIKRSITCCGSALTKWGKKYTQTIRRVETQIAALATSAEQNCDQFDDDNLMTLTFYENSKKNIESE